MIQKKIVFLGDSITEGFKQLEEHPQIINMGISGNRTLEVIERLEKVKEQEPEEVFLMIGTNDIMTNNYIWFTDFPININRTYEFIVKYLIENLNAKITLLSVLPVCPNKLVNDDNIDKITQDIVALNEFIKSLSKTYQLQFIDLHPFFIDEKNHLIKEYTYDGIHLSKKGYEVYYQKIKKFLN
jgi:lysophospholipase L1-like esterase